MCNGMSDDDDYDDWHDQATLWSGRRDGGDQWDEQHDFSGFQFIIITSMTILTIPNYMFG